MKPANVLLDEDGQWRLCDFGFAIVCGDRTLKKGMGTLAYSSPELLACEQGYKGRVRRVGAKPSLVLAAS